ncbi:MAG: hypothetical protein KBT05_01395 [Bacteroidales bacterium]|nr:hypothetical protein [Candidatus Cryptobacteroides caccocaballi]
MKKQYHICITSHEEVMFRNEEDYLRGINSLALTCIQMQDKVCTFSFQTDHIHFDLISDRPGEFVRQFRNRYAMYFNKKYNRKGPLGKHLYFISELEGARHVEAAESYILRNAVHHGIASSPFGYPFNSSTCYFEKDLCHFYLGSVDFSKYKKGLFLPHNRKFPKSYLLNPQGMIDPKHFVEVKLVEKFFGTPRGYLFCMTRLSSEEWEKSQAKDENGKDAITLKIIEHSFTDRLDILYENEKGRNVNSCSDMDVCRIIDTKYLRKYSCNSYAQLSRSQKEAIKDELLTKKGTTKIQIYRCLALSRDDFTKNATR